MADVFADLGVRVDTASARVAVTDFRRLEGAAERLEGSMERHAVAANRVGTTYSRHVAPSIRRTGVAANQLTAYFQNNSFAARSFVWQLNQIAQTGAVTGNWMQSIAIQLPDILGGFGLWGIAAGAVAGALGPLALSMRGTSDSAEELTDAMEALNSAVGDYESAVTDALSSTDELQERFGRFAELSRTMLLRETDRLAREARSQFVGAVEGIFDDVQGEFSGREAWRGFRDFFGESSIAAGDLREQAGTLVRTLRGIRESDSLAQQLNYLIGIRNMFEEMATSRTSAHPEIIAGEQRILDLLDQQILAGLELQAQRERLREGLDPVLNPRQIQEYQTYARTRMEGDAPAPDWDAYTENLHRVHQAWRDMYQEGGEAEERRLVLAQQVYAQTRIASNEQVRTAGEMLAELEEQAAMQQLVARYGADSVQATTERAAAEARATREIIDALDVSEDLKQQLRDALAASRGIANTDFASSIMAGANAASILLGNLRAAAGVFGSVMEELRREQRDAQLRLEHARDPQAYAGARAVEDFRESLPAGGYGMIVAGRAGELSEREARIRSEAEALYESKNAAEAAEKAYQDFLNPKKSGGGGSGGKDEELDLHNERLQEAERLYNETRTAAEQYAIQLAEIRELSQTINPETGETYIDAELTQRALRELREEYLGIAEAARQMEDATTQMFVSIFSGAESASDALGNLLRQFGDMALNAAFAPLMEGMFDGVAQIFATPPRRAAGGPVSANQPYIVGEKQAELFVPRTDGTILPSVPSGGGSSVSVAPTFHIDARGADTAAVERLERALAGVVSTFKERTIDSLREARMEGKLQ